MTAKYKCFTVPLQTVPSHQDLHCLPLLLIFDLNPYLQQWMCPNSKMEESMSETQGERVKTIEKSRPSFESLRQLHTLKTGYLLIWYYASH